jgi:hypothetical protein
MRGQVRLRLAWVRFNAEPNWANRWELVNALRAIGGGQAEGAGLR